MNDITTTLIWADNQGRPFQRRAILHQDGSYSFDQSSATQNPSSVVTGQVKIAVTGTPVRLPAAPLTNGIVVRAKSTNAAQSTSYSATVGSAGVTTTYDGTGNGYPMAPGDVVSLAVADASNLYVNGTAGDVFSFMGN